MAGLKISREGCAKGSGGGRLASVSYCEASHARMAQIEWIFEMSEMTDWTVYYRSSYHGHKARELSLVSPSRGAALKQACWIRQQNQGEIVKITGPNEEISSAEVATWCQNNQAK